MSSEYDEKIISHYNKVADECGLSSQSTMADDVVRTKETNIIHDFVKYVSDQLNSESVEKNGTDAGLRILDVGCGNGHTIKTLAEELELYSYIGVEYNEKLRELAVKQVSGLGNANIISGDVRLRESINIDDESIDILICQRVLINVLDDADAKTALDNIISLVRPNGKLLFIESFSSGLETLNEARAEFDLEPIAPAYHNKYLSDEFFDHPDIELFSTENFNVKKNTFSTHYYITRVLHAALLQERANKGVIRNSHFVRFLSSALPDGVGNYAPLQIQVFQKKQSG